MKKLLSHLDFTRVGHFRSILEQQGIACTVRNANASSVMGEVPYTEVWPELWVLRDEDVERAEQTIEEYTHALKTPIAAWHCPKCNTAVEAGFGECWNCSSPKPE